MAFNTSRIAGGNPLTLWLIGISAAFTAYSFFDPTAVMRFGMVPRQGFSSDTLVRAMLFQFMHGGLLHLFSNAFFLVYFGSIVERNMGTGRYAGLFAFSTAVVAVAVYFVADGITVGISGFAMSVLAYAAWKMRQANDPEARGAFFFLFINVAIGLSGSISLAGHLSGAVAGTLWFLAERLIPSGGFPSRNRGS